jgi:hypothetical protein
VFGKPNHHRSNILLLVLGDHLLRQFPIVTARVRVASTTIGSLNVPGGLQQMSPRWGSAR